MASLESLPFAFSIDYGVIFILVVFFSLFALRGGLSRVSAASIAFMVSIALYTHLPHAHFIGEFVPYITEGLWQPLAVFFILAAIVFIPVASITDMYERQTGEILQSIIVGVASTIMVLVAWHILPGTEKIWTFSETIAALFSVKYVFWWMLISLAFVYIANNRL